MAAAAIGPPPGKFPGASAGPGTPGAGLVPPATLAHILSLLPDAAAHLGKLAAPIKVVTIDGPAGSGKSTLADALGVALPAPVIHMDDLYEGWSGLESSWNRLDEWVLQPLGAGYPGRYRQYDWVLEDWGEWHEVPAGPYLVVEGCGAGRAEADGVASLKIWVEAPVDLRLRRGLDRDGEAMRAHWEKWMVDEVDHYARNRTRERADIRIDAWGEVTGSINSPVMSATSPEAWVAVTREDGETVGYLDPVTDDYAQVIPRNRLGHSVGEAQDFADAEELVLARGLGELTEAWLLDGAGDALTISELSPHGIVLRNALLAKALFPTDPVHVDWPDVNRRLTPATGFNRS